MQKLSDFLFHTKPLIEQHLKSLLDEYTKGYPTQLKECMSYATLSGGKRLRAILHIISGQLFKNYDDKVSLDIACAIEFVHAYSLIHDDLPGMDNSDLRRGKKSAHIRFNEYTAILSGTALYNIALQILTNLSLSKDRNLKITNNFLYNTGGNGILSGQQLDMEFETNKIEEIDITWIKKMQHLKTGALLSSCIETAFYAFSTEKEQSMLHNLKKYAYNLGLIYQITDDLLDIVGDPKKIGKSIDQDAKSGKKTLVSLMGIKKVRTEIQLMSNEACNIAAEYNNSNLLQQLVRKIESRVY